MKKRSFHYLEENNKFEIPEITQKSVFLGIFYRNNIFMQIFYFDRLKK